MKASLRKFSWTLALICIAAFPPDRGRCGADSLPSVAANPIRRITLPHLEPVMPAAAGRDEFMRACVSCHSPRYVTMQPRFSRHQWEDSVHKMINTYGAPLDDAQFGKIVDYLVAIDGVGHPPLESSSSDDDEVAASPNAPLPEATEIAPQIQVAAEGGEHAAEARRGAEVFAQDCTGCHGPQGRGDGIVSSALALKPADLGVARFSVEFLRATLWNGVRGTPMPSWRKPPLSDLTALVAYVQSLHPAAEPDKSAPDALARGSAVFLKNCAPCHGVQGDGKGSVAASLMPPPANFHWMQPDFNYVLKVLRDGIPGTAMPAWNDQISESDRAALASYVRAFYSPQSPNP